MRQRFSGLKDMLHFQTSNYSIPDQKRVMPVMGSGYSMTQCRVICKMEERVFHSIGEVIDMDVEQDWA